MADILTRDPALAQAPRSSDDGELYHYYCCDPDVGYCGSDLRNVQDRPEQSDDLVCVVCADPTTPCPVCKAVA